MMSDNPIKEAQHTGETGEILRPADATLNWVDKFAPGKLRPYLRLARLDRPVGAWLLLWPCWWSLAIAAPLSGNPWPDFELLVLFGIGAVVMRGAGCTLNDLMDRHIDAQVARTRGRPLPSGAVSVPAAIVFMLGLSMVGLVVLSQLNSFAVWVGMASVPLIVVYPLMKRVTYWPQLFLGLTFNWGALLGWAATTGELTLAPVCLYIAGIFWTLGYDTIYAHQDKEDDALVGVRSSALRLGDDTRPWLWGFYAVAVVAMGVSGVLAGMAWPYYIALAVTAAHLAWQASTVDISDSSDCLKKFKSNIGLGWVVFAGCVLGAIM
jgi:4-hydroxybenzoate polyprenyltransferase